MNKKYLPLIISITGLVIVILIILGGSVLAGGAWDPKWNPFVK